MDEGIVDVMIAIHFLAGIELSESISYFFKPVSS